MIVCSNQMVLSSEDQVQGYSIQAQPAAGAGGRYDYVRQQVEE
jgi:hypothetical protein